MKVKTKICVVLIALLALMAIPAVSASSYYEIEDGSNSNWFVIVSSSNAMGCPYLTVFITYTYGSEYHEFVRTYFEYPRSVKGQNGQVLSIEFFNPERFSGYLQNIGGGYRELHLKFKDQYGDIYAEDSWIIPIGVGRWDFVENT